VLREVFAFLKTYRNKKNGVVEGVPRCAMDVHDLVEGCRGQTDLLKQICEHVKETRLLVRQTWDIHNRYDESGRPLWYVPAEIAKSLEAMAKVLQGVSNNQKAIATTLERMRK